MDLFLSGLLWFLFGLVAGLGFAVFLGALAFTVGGAVAIQAARTAGWNAREKATSVRSRERSSSLATELHVVPSPTHPHAEDNAMLVAALHGLKFTGPEIAAAVARAQHVQGPFAERLRAALRKPA